MIFGRRLSRCLTSPHFCQTSTLSISVCGGVGRASSARTTTRWFTKQPSSTEYTLLQRDAGHLPGRPTGSRSARHPSTYPPTRARLQLNGALSNLALPRHASGMSFRSVDVRYPRTVTGPAGRPSASHRKGRDPRMGKIRYARAAIPLGPWPDRTGPERVSRQFRWRGVSKISEYSTGGGVIQHQPLIELKLEEGQLRPYRAAYDSHHTPPVKTSLLYLQVGLPNLMKLNWFHWVQWDHTSPKTRRLWNLLTVRSTTAAQILYEVQPLTVELVFELYDD